MEPWKRETGTKICGPYPGGLLWTHAHLPHLPPLPSARARFGFALERGLPRPVPHGRQGRQVRQAPGERGPRGPRGLRGPGLRERRGRRKSDTRETHTHKKTKNKRQGHTEHTLRAAKNKARAGKVLFVWRGGRVFVTYAFRACWRLSAPQADPPKATASCPACQERCAVSPP